MPEGIPESVKNTYRFFLKESGQMPEIDDDPIYDENFELLGFVSVSAHPEPQTDKYLHSCNVRIIDINAQERELVVRSDSLEKIESIIRDTLKEMKNDFEKPLLSERYIFQPILANEKNIKPGIFTVLDHQNNNIATVTISTFGEKGGGLSNQHTITVVTAEGRVTNFNLEGHDREILNTLIEETLTRP